MALNTTYSLDGWKELSRTVSKKVNQSTSKAVKKYFRLLSSLQSQTGIEDTKKETELTAMAQENIEEIIFSPPLQCEYEITSPYGERIHPVTNEVSFHTGIDLSGEKGMPVLASDDGTVCDLGNDDSNGNFVVLQHEGGYSTVYAHLDSYCVQSGAKVSTGEKIGEIGSTGISTGPHLHFEIKQKGKSINPDKFTDGWHK